METTIELIYFNTYKTPVLLKIEKNKKVILRKTRKPYGGKFKRNEENQFVSSIVQIPTRFHAGSEKISPTP